MDENTVFEGKTTAVLAYITFVGLLIALTMNAQPKNPFARFHINQSAGLTIGYMLIMIPLSYLNSGITFISFFVVFFVLWLYAIISAFQGKTTPVPLVGDLFQKWFGRL